jgi:hypothetical protein
MKTYSGCMPLTSFFDRGLDARGFLAGCSAFLGAAFRFGGMTIEMELAVVLGKENQL